MSANPQTGEVKGPVRNAAAAEAPGLKKSFSAVSAWAFSVGCAVGWGTFVMPGTTLLPTGGPLGTALAFGLGAAGLLVIAVIFGYLAKSNANAGGIYAYAEDAFGPNHAFVCSWCLVLVYTAAIAANATALSLIVRGLFGPVLQVGPHYAIIGYEVYGGELLLALVVVGAVTALSVLSARAVGIIQTVCAVGLVGGALALACMALADPAASFPLSEPAFAPDNPPLVGTLGVLLIVPWAFVGFESVCHSSEEAMFPTSRYTAVLVLAVVAIAVAYVAPSLVTASVVPEGYPSWVEYIQAAQSLEGVQSLPSFNAGFMLGGAGGLMLVGFTALCTVLTGMFGFMQAASRLIYSMARDGALSARFAKVDPKHGTPVQAIVAISIVTLAAAFAGRNVLNWVVDLLSLGAVIAYGYASCAVVKKAGEEHRVAMRMVGLVGLVLSIAMLVLILGLVPGVGSTLSPESYIILVAWIAMGVNFFTPTIVRQT